MLGWERESGVVKASRGKTGHETTERNTTEASILLKTKEGTSKTKLKPTQNVPQLSAEMRAWRVELEFYDTSGAWAGAWNGGAARARYRSGGGIPRVAKNYENRGNEAKNYLKTKDITFSSAANYARLARKLAPIGH